MATVGMFETLRETLKPFGCRFWYLREIIRTHSEYFSNLWRDSGRNVLIGGPCFLRAVLRSSPKVLENNFIFKQIGKGYVLFNDALNTFYLRF